MDWFDYLRRQRQQNLDANEMLTAGRVRLHETRDGVSRDTTEDKIAENLRHIQEIEQILAMAGQQIEEAPN